MEIRGCSALVTGGASGLGRATAKMLHDAGAKVVVLDLPTSQGAEAVAEIGADVTFVAGDVTRPGDVQAAVEAAAARAPLRIAVAAAGVVGAPRRLLERDGPLSSEHFQPIFDVNVAGTLHLVARAAETMAAQAPEGDERGVIVCTASVSAFEGQIGQVAYAASKGAVVGLVLPAARELARHLVRVVAIAPGLFDTPMLAGLPERARHAGGGQVLHPARLGRPEEYAALVEHLVRNAMLNGEVVRLDGAIRLAPR